MKIHRVVHGFLLAGFFSAMGCGHLDLAPAGNPDRVITGTVQCGAALPAGAEVVVRLLTTTTRDPLRPPGDVPIAVSATPPQPVEQVIASSSQILPNGTTQPVPFRIEYHAEDTLMHRGLTLDARISYDGKLRYRSINAHLVTMSGSAYPQQVSVQPADR